MDGRDGGGRVDSGGAPFTAPSTIPESALPITPASRKKRKKIGAKETRIVVDQVSS